MTYPGEWEVCTHEGGIRGHWPEDEGAQSRRALRQIIERLDVIIDLMIVAGPGDNKEERT